MNEGKRFESPEFREEPKTVEVDQFEGWKLAGSPDVIETTALGPCLGVAIYDPESKQAMVGHFTEPRISDFPEMLDEARKRFGDSEKLRVFIGGGSPDLSNDPALADHRDKRDFINKQLEDHGFKSSQVTAKYQDSATATILRVDTSTGNVDYDEETNWEMLDSYDY